MLSIKYMAKRCDLCKRSSTKGAKRSHSNIKTLKRQNINLQSRVVDGVKVKICTKCLRTIAKKQAEFEAKEAKKPVAKKVKKKQTKKQTVKKTKKLQKKL